MPPSRQKTRRLLIGVMIAATALSAVFFGLAFWLVVAAQPSSARPSTVAEALPPSSADAAPAQSGTWPKVASAGDSASATQAPSGGEVAAARVPATAGSTVSRGASLDAYRGLASWIDIYDTRAWSDPSAAVNDMASHGVRTLFIETANYHSPDAVFRPDAQAAFISAAHARGMKVVAWYLPDMKPGSVDTTRIMRAIQFRTPDGQGFDSFALDIEDTSISSEAVRNADLKRLSDRIRSAAGPSYPLGAIIPSPVGLARSHSSWANFPYTMLAGVYDVFVPMGYYTYHGSSAGAALSDVRDNLRILRSKPGCADVPVHLIGGIAENSSDAQTKAFVDGVLRGDCIGASLYGWAGTSQGAWRALSAIKP
jgi:hypothetical protein